MTTDTALSHVRGTLVQAVVLGLAAERFYSHGYIVPTGVFVVLSAIAAVFSFLWARASVGAPESE
jgi:hypothetical protein